ncbi:MAG TPA: NUDIX domain-containing protein [Pseudonocardiaceae bacterium]|jgi:8-oxo-dGTP pyrophosphatase MutT (NUDIX family)|nr:NUDIX domain-containing protein [Pseudonocardiaceae bacterium]
MITNDEIRDTLTRYLTRYPDEAEHLAPLTRALERGGDLTSRKTFDGGHVTCGAVVIDDTNRLLLIQHKALGRWLLPGGHLETEDNGLMLAALRELEEETGISWHGAVSPPGQDVIDIDIHLIPANRAKGEPEHWHADFRWAFWVQEPKVVLQAEEVKGYAWRPCADAPTPKLAAKLHTLYPGLAVSATERSVVTSTHVPQRLPNGGDCLPQASVGEAGKAAVRQRAGFRQVGDGGNGGPRGPGGLNSDQ